MVYVIEIFSTKQETGTSQGFPKNSVPMHGGRNGGYDIPHYHLNIAVSKEKMEIKSPIEVVFS